MLVSTATLLIVRDLTRVLEENKRTEPDLRSIGAHLRESGEGTALVDCKTDGRHASGTALVLPQVVCKADDPGSRQLPCALTVVSGSPAGRSIEIYERELIHYRSTEISLRGALAKSAVRLRQTEELIQRQKLLKNESDHRLLNDLQMVISLLSLHSRGSTNAEAAKQLAVAANRVAMIARIHHRLNSYGGMQTIEFKQFLAEFSRDFSVMVSSAESPEQVILEGVEINLPAATAIPLGFIASVASTGQRRSRSPES